MEDILSYLNESIINIGKYYDAKHIPMQIGQAIYNYGNSDIFDILAFVDVSQECDGSSGMIITPTHVYFRFAKKGVFAYKDIQKLVLEKNRNEQMMIIQTQESTYRFKNNYLNKEKFLMFLSDITQLEVQLQMRNYEKVEYYVHMIIEDIEDDLYEDVILTSQQKLQLKELKENLDVVSHMEDNVYQDEIKTLCSQALSFFCDLELDSEEIDELIKIENEFSETSQQKQVQDYYDEMMSQYAKGHTDMYDQLRQTMDSLGIHEDDLKNKTPEEMNAYIDHLCERFGISRSTVESLAKKFTR